MKFTVDMLDFTKAVDLLCDLFGGSLLSCTLKRAEHGQQGGETSQKKKRVFPEPYATVPRHL